MTWKENIKNIILSNGYIKEGFGYKRITVENTHWITLFDNCLQIYAYFTEDEECNKIYDTGIVSISGPELQIFIKVLTFNHN